VLHIQNLQSSNSLKTNFRLYFQMHELLTGKTLLIACIHHFLGLRLL
jgi:hypothetical protein